MTKPIQKKSSVSRSALRTHSKVPVTFEYFDPAAAVVTLVGEFNQWDSKARPLKRDAGGLWKVTVRLEPGSYQYKFVVNGDRWEEDALNLHRIQNEHGSFNSLLKIGPFPTGDQS